MRSDQETEGRLNLHILRMFRSTLYFYSLIFRVAINPTDTISQQTA